MQLSIECQKRPEGSKPNALRREGKIPATLYGHAGAESMSLVLDTKAAQLLLKEASINNTLIKVDVPDASWSGKALLREVQTHPWKGFLYHISFFSVAAQDSVNVTVPLNFVGVPKGVKVGGGMLAEELTELAVSCAPESIPDHIDVDVSNLEIGHAIHVNELVLPEGITALGEEERIVASVLQPRTSAGVTESEEATVEVGE
jgi:large subunit ribosomal protein L25